MKRTIFPIVFLAFLPLVGNAQVTMQVNAEGKVVTGLITNPYQTSPSGTTTSLRVLSLNQSGYVYGGPATGNVPLFTLAK